MDKFISCNHCKEMYHCERTYLGGCVYGKEYDEFKQQPIYTGTELETQAMLNTPITDLSKLIAQKWFSPLEKLAEEAGVSVNIVKNAVRGKDIRLWNERKIRAVLEKL